MKRYQKLILLALLLIVPVAGAIFLSTGKHTYKALPYYGERVAQGQHMRRGKVVVDTLYHQVEPWQGLVDQGGRPFDTSAMSGKIVVANFFFTTCPNICKDMTRGLRDVAKRYDFFHDLLIVSHSVNPEYDSPERLRAYAAEWNIDTTHWKLVTGDKEQIYNLASKGYYLPIEEVPGGKDFIHSEKLMLLDRQRHIRGIYDGTSTYEIKRLIEDINVLNKQETSVIQAEQLP